MKTRGRRVATGRGRERRNEVAGTSGRNQPTTVHNSEDGTWGSLNISPHSVDTFWTTANNPARCEHLETHSRPRLGGWPLGARVPEAYCKVEMKGVRSHANKQVLNSAATESLISDVCLREMNARVHAKTCTRILKAALFIIGPCGNSSSVHQLKNG